MKFLENYKEHVEKTDRTKKDTYMFSDIHEDKKGNLIGYCKFCKKEFDVAEHTNECPNVPKDKN